MKRFLSVFLCVVLLLGTLPFLNASAAERIIGEYAYVSVNKTSAKVGDIINFWVLGEDTSTDFGDIYYDWYIVRNGNIIANPLYGYGEWDFYYIVTEPGTYNVVVQLTDSTDGDIVYLNCDYNVAVSLLPSPKFTSVEATSGTSLKLTWGKVAGASGYEIWRSTSKTGEYKLIKTTTAITFSNTYLKAGTRYFYKIRAYKLVYGSKIPNSAFSAIKAGVPLAKAAIISATGVSRTQVKLTWQRVVGATGYQIFRSGTAGGVYTAIKTTSALSLTIGGLKAKTTYYFKVRAYKQFGTVKYYGPTSGYKAGKTK